MSKSKIVGMVALIVFAVGIVLVGNAVAGEKFKMRAHWYWVKAEPINVPREEGRFLAVFDYKGILTVLEGNKLMDGMAAHNVGVGDVNPKAGTGFGHGELLFTDRNGDKVYWTWEGKAVKGIWSGPATCVGGTGKFKGMKGESTWSEVVVGPNLSYVDWDGEIELPR
jgi:hypothetical protein